MFSNVRFNDCDLSWATFAYCFIKNGSFSLSKLKNTVFDCSSIDEQSLTTHTTGIRPYRRGTMMLEDIYETPVEVDVVIPVNARQKIILNVANGFFADHVTFVKADNSSETVFWFKEKTTGEKVKVKLGQSYYNTGYNADIRYEHAIGFPIRVTKRWY